MCRAVRCSDAFFHMFVRFLVACTCQCHCTPQCLPSSTLFDLCHPETYSGLISLKWWQLLKAKANELKDSVLHSSCREWL
uniref:Secreted protein n=1 Tax=Rhipicephalus appendiculatus TaxID=34631 RepID=A0A131YD20_RHIAP